MEEKEHISDRVLPILALRGLAVFPNMLMHFDVGREASVRALDEAMGDDSIIFLVSQKDLAVEKPEVNDLYTIGTIATVKQILRLPGDNVRVVVEGISRGRITEIQQEKPSLRGAITELASTKVPKKSIKAEALVRDTHDQFGEYVELAGKEYDEILLNALDTRDPGYLADYIIQNLPVRVAEKQIILDELRPIRRLELLSKMLVREIDILEYSQEVQGKTKDRMEGHQRDYYLREQLKVLKEELGDSASNDDEIEEFRTKIQQQNLPEQVATKLNKELNRLAKQPFGSAEGTVLRNYLDICLELPWNKTISDEVDIKLARKVLDADHYGMEKVKERVIEYLAVKQLSPEIKGQVLCLVGPPGVGKTSVATSIAKALNRKFARVSLGGVHDESEIRGHRKTYVGSMPGRIVEAIRQSGSMNPVILLDEIDKMTASHQGDPSAALLEVLDMEQNSDFRDHFLELPLDLSDAIFIATANSLSTVSRPLLDRMELIELPSYTDEEKVEITKQHLLPKEMKRHGLHKGTMKLSADGIRTMIRSYTREAGVRNLTNQLSTLTRKVAVHLVSTEHEVVSITAKNLIDFLGTPKYTEDTSGEKNAIGLVNGLAWTQVGGELLKVEVNVVPGTGKVELTGNLGKVMKESASAALSCIRSRTTELGIDPNFYKSTDIHVHFPEGAVPKDGPSAGIAITTAIVSVLTGKPVRSDVAMTGEVTLRGRVLPIGGLREKTMAAVRNKVNIVIIPAANEKDLAEIDPLVKAKLEFVVVHSIEEVLEVALTHSVKTRTRRNVRTEKSEQVTSANIQQ